MDDKRHIHLIGICGTAMASLAGMLKQRGFRVTGSDAAAYPPMSDFLRELGITVAQPFDAHNLDPQPDLVVVGNAISRGNIELEHVLDRRIVFCSLPQLLHFCAGRKCWLSQELMARPPRLRCWPGFSTWRGCSLHS
jgi:UDP-N-acetylmuramate: L-alanyl-gamma-D-glutamyl-meso-diaminopimelate ligase